jgi:hypothetical protein
MARAPLRAPLEDRGSGGTADAVVNVRGEHDTTELVVEAVDSFIVERDLEADADMASPG